MRHFAPYGSTNAACDETVPRRATPPTTGDTGIYSDPRFTTRRAETTCPECRFRCGVTSDEVGDI